MQLVVAGNGELVGSDHGDLNVREALTEPLTHHDDLVRIRVPIDSDQQPITWADHDRLDELRNCEGSHSGSLVVDLLPAVNGGDSYRAAHAAPRRVPASPRSARVAPGLTSAPQAFRLSTGPAARWCGVLAWLSPAHPHCTAGV